MGTVEMFAETPRWGHNERTARLGLLADDARHALERAQRGEEEAIAGWLAYGAALNEGRALLPGDLEFGHWLRSAKLAEGMHDHERAAAMWAAANPDQFAEARAASNARTVRGIHAKWKELEAQRLAERETARARLRVAERPRQSPPPVIKPGTAPSSPLIEAEGPDTAAKERDRRARAWHLAEDLVAQYCHGNARLDRDEAGFPALICRAAPVSCHAYSNTPRLGDATGSAGANLSVEMSRFGGAWRLICRVRSMLRPDPRRSQTGPALRRSRPRWAWAASATPRRSGVAALGDPRQPPDPAGRRHLGGAFRGKREGPIRPARPECIKTRFQTGAHMPPLSGAIPPRADINRRGER